MNSPTCPENIRKGRRQTFRVVFFFAALDQWSDYYDDADEEALIHDTYKYYFPDQYNEEYRYTE